LSMILPLAVLAQTADDLKNDEKTPGVSLWTFALFDK
jgi:hypothetical protein